MYKCKLDLYQTNDIEDQQALDIWFVNDQDKFTH